MKTANNISCILLAAGASSRFGRPKMAAKLDDGTPMLLATLAKYQTVFSQVLVVVRPASQISAGSQPEASQLWQKLRTQLHAKGATVLDSPNAEQGMSQSLIAGVRASKDASAWLIALGDMPYVQASTIQGLCNVVSGSTIRMPSYRGVCGNPVVFGKDYYDALTTISGDQGAKSVTQQYSDKRQLVEVEDQGVLQDIDTPEHILTTKGA